MPQTARDIVEGAYELIGVTSRGYGLSAEDANDGLVALNDYLAEISAYLKVPIINKISGLSLTTGVDVYTVGASGDLVTPLPQSVEFLFVISGGVKHQVDVVGGIEWINFYRNSTNQIPIVAFYDEGRLRVAPAPDQGYSIEMWVVSSLTTFATLSTQSGFGDEFAPFLKSNLAVRMAPSNGKEAKDTVKSMAFDTRIAVETKYARNEPTQSDLPGARRGKRDDIGI